MACRWDSVLVLVGAFGFSYADARALADAGCADQVIEWFARENLGGRA